MPFDLSNTALSLCLLSASNQTSLPSAARAIINCICSLVKFSASEHIINVFSKFRPLNDCNGSTTSVPLSNIVRTLCSPAWSMNGPKNGSNLSITSPGKAPKSLVSLTSTLFLIQTIFSNLPAFRASSAAVTKINVLPVPQVPVNNLTVLLGSFIKSNAQTCSSFLGVMTMFLPFEYFLVLDFCGLSSFSFPFGSSSGTGVKSLKVLIEPPVNFLNCPFSLQ